MRKMLVRLVKIFIGKLEPLPLWLCPSLEHLRHSSLLGSASLVSTPSDEKIISAILSVHLQSWVDRETPKPSRISVFETSQLVMTKITDQKSLQISIVMPRYWPHNDMESDLWVQFSSSATCAGHIVSQFDTGDISYDDHVKRPMNYGQNLNSGIVALKEFLLSEKPDVVVFDGNFIPHGRSISREVIRDMKSDLGFKLCTIIGDLHDLQPQSRLDYWGEVSDLVVVFNTKTRHYVNFDHKEKVLVSPVIPFDEHCFHWGVEREIGLGFCGGKGRRRDVFLSFAEQCGIPTTTHFVDDKNYLTDGEFRDFLSRSRITFSNGFVGTLGGLPYSVMTGRIAESILSGSLLIYESGSQIDDYLVPYVHYIPVDNIHELVHFCRYLLKNEEIRAGITASAYEYWMENYSSKKFWNCVTQRLCNVVAP